MDPIRQFTRERNDDIKRMVQDAEFRKKSLEWMIHADKFRYTYNFTWMGRPIIKYPNDIVVYQELIWDLKPDLIIETGIAHGGSLVLSASLLNLTGKGRVVGIDIDIREHNRIEIEKHPMNALITMIEGDSTSEEVQKEVESLAEIDGTTVVVLDSNHTHEHVLRELNIYHRFVGKGSYIILPDTFIEFFPRGYYLDRPWDVGNNPYTAMLSFLENHPEFGIDEYYSSKAMITESFSGYLKRK
jgi:cephalosporin hydroxylase